MDNLDLTSELSQKVMIHLYNSAVAGVLRSTDLVLGSSRAIDNNPRLRDLHAALKGLGNDKRLLYTIATAFAEFAVYCTIDFIENYNMFDSEHNEDVFPHLSLVYMDKSDVGIKSVPLSKWGSSELTRQFRQMSRSNEMRSHIESTINALITKDGAAREQASMEGEEQV